MNEDEPAAEQDSSLLQIQLEGMNFKPYKVNGNPLGEVSNMHKGCEQEAVGVT